MYEIRPRFSTPSVDRRSLFIDLVGGRADVLDRLAALDQQLLRATANPRVVTKTATPRPFRLADPRTMQDRITELAGGEVPYQMAQLEPNWVASETISAAEGVAAYYPDEMELSAGAITVRGVATLRWDATGNVTECTEFPQLVGRNVLLALACFIEQDFGTVVMRGDRLFYVCECSEFEKTPKQVDGGGNGFLGADFLEWHVRIPHYGALLASIFRRTHELFSKDALDMLVVDLRGRHLYTDGRRIIRRYERDYVVPLRDASGAYVGLNVFADLLIGDIDELRHPLVGGPYLQIVSPIEFHRTFKAIKHAGFTEHPIGMREADGSPRRTRSGSNGEVRA